jgi:hypothetical protein
METLLAEYREDFVNAVPSFNLRFAPRTRSSASSLWWVAER